MLRLRWCVLAHLISSPATSPISPLHRLVSAAALAVSPSTTSFAAQEYLVSTCGLTRAQALKASAKLSHLKSPAKPDAVLAFLAGLGLSGADVAPLVARDPLILCAKVEKTLAPIADGLTSLGLSRSEITRLVSVAGAKFRTRTIVPNVHYFLTLFGSPEDLLRLLKRDSYLLTADLERVVKPNFAFLRECGLATCDIAKLCLSSRWLLTSSPERLGAMVACAQGLGVPCRSGMFRHAMQTSEEEIAARIDYLRSTFSWTDAEVRIALSKAPSMLTRSKESLQRRSEFLIFEVGLQPAYIAQRLVIISHNLEGRLRPRYYAVKFLKENGLLKRDPSYYTVFKESDMVFKKKFIWPHKEAAPHLEEDYAAACKGEVPTNFRFT